MPNGTQKSGNTLNKDFISDMSFTNSDRIQDILFKADHLMPPGTILAWMEGYYTTAANVGFTSKRSTTYTQLNNLKLFNEFYIIADGSVCNIASSTYFGIAIPNLTDSRFLMGSLSIPGAIGGSNFLIDHTHTNTLTASIPTSGAPIISHVHSTSSESSTYGVMLDHHIPLYYGEINVPAGIIPPVQPTRKLISDDAHDHTGAPYVSAGLNANANHTHPWFDDTESSSVSITTSHNHTIGITGTIGSGAYPSSTNNVPKYLSCVYLFKVI